MIDDETKTNREECIFMTMELRTALTTALTGNTISY